MINMFKDITDIVFSTISEFNYIYPSSNFMNVAIQEEKQEEMISQLQSIVAPFTAVEIQILIKSIQELRKEIKNLAKDNRSKFFLKNI